MNMIARFRPAESVANRPGANQLEKLTTREVVPARERYPEPEDAEPGPNFRKATLAGLIAVVIGFGGFLTWGFTATLDSAAVAQGYVVVDSKRKTVSHLEGGILKRVLVSDGDVVTVGQPLLELDDTRARAALDQFTGMKLGLVARLARLKAEQEGVKVISFPPEFDSTSTDTIRTVIRNEQAVFDQRWQLYEGSLDAQAKAVEQFQAEADAADAMAKAADQQRVLISEQLEKIRGLAEKGYATWRSARELETQLSQIIGNFGQYTATRARATQAKAGAAIALLALKMDRQRSVAEDMQDAQLKLNETDQSIVAAQDILSRLVVRAPQAGTILELQVTTSGSSVAAGQKLLDIVPEDQAMIVEGRLATRDVDAVQVGAPTQVRLTGYAQRSLAPLEGTLTYVGADQTADERTGLAYYSVKASVSPESLAKHPSVSLVPGMPADLVVKHRSRLAIDYFIEPISNSFHRAFLED